MPRVPESTVDSGTYRVGDQVGNVEDVARDDERVRGWMMTNKGLDDLRAKACSRAAKNATNVGVGGEEEYSGIIARKRQLRQRQRVITKGTDEGIEDDTAYEGENRV